MNYNHLILASSNSLSVNDAIVISIIFIIIKSNNLEDQIHVVPFQKRDLSKISECSSFQFLDMGQLEQVCQNVTGKEKTTVKG